MKKASLLFLAVAFLTLAFSLSSAAQRRSPSPVTYRNGNLYDGSGTKIDDGMAIDLFGKKIWSETYRGAVQQYKSGKILVIAGASAIVAGAGIMALGFVIADGSDGEYDYYMDGYGYRHRDYNMSDDEQTGLAVAALGGIMVTGGSMAASAGIPFMVIGKQRLKWIAEDYNSSIKSPLRSFFSLNAGRNGLGLAYNF